MINFLCKKNTPIPVTVVLVGIMYQFLVLFNDILLNATSMNFTTPKTLNDLRYLKKNA